MKRLQNTRLKTSIQGTSTISDVSAQIYNIKAVTPPHGSRIRIHEQNRITHSTQPAQHMHKLVSIADSMIDAILNTGSNVTLL